MDKSRCELQITLISHKAKLKEIKYWKNITCEAKEVEINGAKYSVANLAVAPLRTPLEEAIDDISRLKPLPLTNEELLEEIEYHTQEIKQLAEKLEATKGE